MEELIRVLERTISSSQADQNAAFSYIQECIQKDSTEFLRALADILYNQQNSPVVRAAAGLQLKNQLTARDEVLRLKQQHKWRSLPEQTKLYIKECVFKALGTELIRPFSTPQCVAYIAVAELTEKQWPEFISVLVQNAKTPQANDELRLATLEAIVYICQDIVNNEHQQPSKKKDITNGLNASMTAIYGYIGDCINSQNYDLMCTSLNCLSGLMSWAQVSKDLLGFLCQLLRNYQPSQAVPIEISDQKLKVICGVCDCLNVCLERKHSKPDSFDVRISLFEDINNLRAIITILDEIHRSPMKQDPETLFEAEKKLCQVLTNIVRYVYICPPELPQNVMEMFSIIKVVQGHPAITVSIEAIRFWNRVFAVAPRKPVEDDLIASLLIICANRLIRQEFDCKLYGFEFDCQQEFDEFQHKFRNETVELCRNLTLQNDRISFELVSNSIAKCIQQRSNNLNEWEALANLSSAVCSRLKDPSIYLTNGVELVKALMVTMDNTLHQAALIPADSSGSEASLMPDLISTQLSCVSALYVFLPYWHQSDQELTKNLLRKVILFAFHRPDKFIESSRQIVGNNMQLLNNESFLRGFRALARHASANFVRCCLNHSKHLLNLFDFLKSSIDYLYAMAVDNPYSTEKCQLYEGLMLICNESLDENTRKKFVLELFESISWFKDYELNCDQFIEFVGLNRFELEQEGLTTQNMISQPSPVSQINRVKLNYVVNFIGAIAKRLSSRESLLPEILTFTKPILNIIFTMHTLWLPEMRTKCVKEYQPFLFAPFNSTYKDQILQTILVQSTNSGDKSSPFSDIPNRPSKGTSGQYIELLSWNFYDTLLGTMGNIISKTSPELFTYVSSNHFQTALTGAEYLPSLKMHKLIKNFIMPLINSCSKSQQLIETQLLPLLGKFLPFLFDALDSQWKKFEKDEEMQMHMNGVCDKSDQSNKLADEMVQDQLLRNLSRDFIDLMNMILIENVQPNDNTISSNANASNNNNSNHNCNNLISPANPPSGQTNRHSNQVELHKISVLGLNLLSGGPAFVLKVMASTLTWSDSTLNYKSTFINQHLIKHIINANLVENADSASMWLGSMFQCVITSLRMFGEHEQNFSSLLTLFITLYENLNKTVPNFHDDLERMTGITKSAFLKYDHEALKYNEKSRRASLRKVLDSLTTKNI